MPVNFDTRRIRARIEKAAYKGVVRGTNLVRNEVLRLIRDTAKTGRIYTRDGVEHRASAPGEPPAVDRGQHVKLITAEYDKVNLSGTVNSAVAYAAALEFGTPKMEPRPHMRPALVNKRNEIVRAIADEIEREFK